MSKRKADLKVVILGAADVGKTTFIHRYIHGSFKDNESTIGASFSLKHHNGYNIAIWDTAGGERFHGLSNFYCRNAGAAILAYDLTQPNSFKLLDLKFRPLLAAAEPNCLNVVVGMKADQLKASVRIVSSEQVLSFAKNINVRTLNNIPHFETSSLTGHNVEDVFEYIYEICLPRMAQQHIQNPIASSHSVNLTDNAPSKTEDPEGKRKSRCC